MTGSEAKPFSGFPPFHFVGGNIDEPTVPAEALAEAVGRVLRNQGLAIGKYGMNSGPQGNLPMREYISDRKTIAPALRVGYLVAPWPLMGHILPLKTDAGSGALEQMVLAEFLPEHFDDHVSSMLPMLKNKADTLCAALDEHFGASAEYDVQPGGIYLWVTPPEVVDPDYLRQVVLSQGVDINPGS